MPLPDFLWALSRIGSAGPPQVRRRPGLRLFGIDVTLDPSWFLIVLLLVLSRSGPFGWGGAAAASLIFFASILAHELAHSLVARAKGIEVSEITLFVFGGVSRLKEEARRPADEVQVAGIGPVTSMALALLFAAASLAFPAESLAREIARWLGTMNLLLAGFNLLPGFPLDGGRILRAIVWDVTGNLDKATRVASAAGSVLAYLMIFGGMTLAFAPGGSLASGLWMAFVGWFLLSASSTATRQFRLGEALTRLRVDQAMRTTCAEAPGQETVREFVEERLLRTGERCYVVPEGPGLKGLVTLHQVKNLPRSEWDRTRVEEIMIPARDVRAVSPHESLREALEKMESAAVNQLPVLDGPVLRGLLTREDVLHRVALQMELARR